MIKDQVINELRSSGWFNDVVNIFTNAAKLESAIYPIAYFGGYKHIKGSNIRSDANIVLSFIIGDLDIVTNNDVEFIGDWVKSNLDCKLHNYANSLSYGVDPVETIEEIQLWQICNSLLNYFRYDFYKSNNLDEKVFRIDHRLKRRK